MNNKASGKIRIIAGQWRGRKIQVADVPGLRPSSDRTREILFNWLMPVLEGARCLDLFAGSGALGFEAASRGAGFTLLLEQNPQAVRALRAAAVTLNATHIEIIQADARVFLRQAPAQPFDIIFLDPPFAANLLPSVCQALQSPGWLQASALIYLEMARTQAFSLPPNWALLRRHDSRDSSALLVQKQSAGKLY
jgi:16S rRNA (guanine966-N2)-methyltransferase